MPIDDLTDPHAFLPATRNYSNGCYLTINAGVHMFTFRFRGGAEVPRSVLEDPVLPLAPEGARTPLGTPEKKKRAGDENRTRTLSLGS